MRQLSSIGRVIQDVPSFASRYEQFIKKLENQGASDSTIKNYGYNFALICLTFGRLPEEITDDEYTDYFNKFLKGNTSRLNMLTAMYCVRKYFKMIGLQCPLAASPGIPSKKTLPLILSKKEVLSLLQASNRLGKSF